MKAFKIILLTIATLFTMTGCCWTDHSETIKEVADPMLMKLKQFYAEKKYFPNIEERNKILEKVGCKVNGDVCKYKGKKIALKMDETDYDFTIDFGISNSYCVLHYMKKTNRNVVNCNQKPCIDLGQ